MRLLLIPVWAGLLSGVADGAVHRPMTAAFANLPEPSSAAMLVVGACAVAIGLIGRRRRAS